MKYVIYTIIMRHSGNIGTCGGSKTRVDPKSDALSVELRGHKCRIICRF